MHIILCLVYFAQPNTVVLPSLKYDVTSLIHVAEQAIACVHAYTGTSLHTHFFS